MPGLVGLITRLPRQAAEARLGRMLEVMRHELFYVSRTHVDEELGVYVGWTACEGSFSDRAAAISELGDVAVILCGEEYSAPGLSPSSLVHAYEDAPSFPAGLNGMFHGVVVDRRRRRVLLFNDRYGMHRLYWHESNDAVYFAAEAKAVLAVCPAVRRLDPRGLGETIGLGCVLNDRTVFDGLSVVPGGSLWTFEDAKLARRGMYFRPEEWEEQPVVDAETSHREIREAFRVALPRCLAGAEPIGMSLTGGLDTRMVMAWQDRAPGALPCYTFGGTYRDSQDVKVAREVARACGQPFHVIQLGDEFLKRFAHYAERAIVLTDGCVDPRLAADVYLNERARRIAPVRMTGLYGGEVLRRVRAFVPESPLSGLFAPVAAEIEQARTAYARALDAHPLSFAVFRQAPWHHHGSLSLERTQVAMRSPFLDNGFIKTLFRAPHAVTTSDALSLRLIAEGSPGLAAIPTDRGLDGSGTVKERLARARSALTFKAEYVLDYGAPRWLAPADRALGWLRLERLFLGRHKFAHFGAWYRGPLAPYVRDVLLDPRSLARPYLDRKAVEHVVRSHTRGDRNYTTEIHRLIRLELLCRHFVDNSGSTFGGAEEPRW